MCSIVGAVLQSNRGIGWTAARVLEVAWQQGMTRGRDGRGFVSVQTDGFGGIHRVIKRSPVRREDYPNIAPLLSATSRVFQMVGNHRAEPTTEYVKQKQETDQQPYSVGGWHVVHNGTIANDKELRTHGLDTKIDSAAIAELLADQPPTFTDFAAQVRKLKGSFAILAMHESAPTKMFVACNYRPVWYVQTPEGYFFASSRNAFYGFNNPQMLRPYSVAEFTSYGSETVEPLQPPQLDKQQTALVVCSGGLDSVVSAAAMVQAGYKIHLLHFLYGSRAQGPEVEAVKAVAKELKAELDLFPLSIYRKGDSPLLDPDSKVAGGEAGAEFAHEWVPARNTVLLAVATAFAEARGYEVIVLGNNLEEAGAYPDNEPEFVARFNDLLPFAVGDGKRMRIEMPVGNLMKHEIVKLGHSIGAPMHLTWSCYRSGLRHCGTCGPCYMRRKAFEINGLPEVIQYQE